MVSLAVSPCAFSMFGESEPPSLLPVNTVLPVIAGTPNKGEVLTVSNGSWTNSPFDFAWQWKADGVAIFNATNDTYLVKESDIGAVISCEVMAFNAHGDGIAESEGVTIEFVGLFDGLTTGLRSLCSSNRRLLSSWTGALIRVRREADNAILDVGFDAAGYLDIAALMAFAAGGSLKIVRVFDQTGSGNHLELPNDSPTLQPYIVESGTLYLVNDVPVVHGNNKILGTPPLFGTTGTGMLGSTWEFLLSARQYGGPQHDYGALFQVDASGSRIQLFDGEANNWTALDPSYNEVPLGKNQDVWEVHGAARLPDGAVTLNSGGDSVATTAGVPTYGGLKVNSGLRIEFAEMAAYDAPLGEGRPAVYEILKNRLRPSLAVTLAATIDTGIAGKTPSVAKPIYSTFDHTTPSYTPSIDCWGAAFADQLTAISAQNSESTDGRKAGILVSPRHVLFSKHFAPSTGATMRFVKTDGTVVTRTISNTAPVSEIVTMYPDVTVALLDSDVPAGIAFARVLPDNWKDYLNPVDQHIPVMWVDQDKRLLVKDLEYLPANKTGNISAGYLQPTDATRLGFYEAGVNFDSGSPCFVKIDSKLVLISLVSFGGPGPGTPIQAFRTEINAAMTSLGGGYSLTSIDLSPYRKIQ